MGNLFGFAGARAHVRALMTRKSCAVGIRNAILRNYLNVKTPFFGQGYAKAVPIFFRQSHTRTRNLVKYCPRVVFAESFHAMMEAYH